MERAWFGPAGNSYSFQEMGYKKTIQMPEYLTQFQLDAYEYQCGHGVRISAESARLFGEAAQKAGIRLSLHAPYYISLSSVEEEKRNNSIQYILQAAEAAYAMGADRVVVHSGSCSKMSRDEALFLACDTLRRAQQELDERNLSEIHLCPETMGKLNQLGNLEEVMKLCSVDERFIPCIDFGHLNARTLGGVSSAEDFAHILDTMGNALGTERAHSFHSHFSKIEYTEKGGEKRHLTFEDTTYGPNFEPLAELVVSRGLHPVFICESAGTQAEDARFMKQVYQNYLKG
jgi:deoxyribonuclease-4